MALNWQFNRRSQQEGVGAKAFIDTEMIQSRGLLHWDKQHICNVQKMPACPLTVFSPPAGKTEKTVADTILIKGTPYKHCFTNRSVTTIAQFLEDNRLLFVSKKRILIIFDPTFSFHEKCMPRINLHGKPKAKISRPMLLYKRATNVLYDVSCCDGLISAVNIISYQASVTVHFNISRNKFADSIEPHVVNNKRSHRDVMSARPVSLDPAGTKRLEHSTEGLSIGIVYPIYRIIAQPSDDVDERMSLYHNSRSSEQDISMDQYTFYQPRLTSILQSQSQVSI